MSATHERGQSAHVFRFAADIILGIIAGTVLALIAANLLLYAEGKSVYRTVNAWSTTIKAGKPGNSILLQAVMAIELPAVNVAEESV